MTRLLVPARPARAEIIVVNSRFIADAAPAFSVEEARAFIQRIRAEFPDATHHVPAYLIGHGSTVIAHCSDAGEPAGTAGRPMLAVLQGSGLGDIVVVVTRYFGGTKLGTGGLVRAYSDAVRAVLEVLPRAEKVYTHTAMFELPYPLYERARLLVEELHGEVLEADFAAQVTLTVRFRVEDYPAFVDALREFSRGTVEPLLVEAHQLAFMPLDAAASGGG